MSRRDNNGNTKTKSDGTQYTWDPENRLTQVTLPGTAGTVTFKYDPFGRRVQKSFTTGSGTTTTNYVYDGANLLEEVDNSGNVLARYTQSGSIDEPLAMLRGGAMTYYEQDGLGSVTSLSGPSGTIGANDFYTYDSYGKTTTSSTIVNPFRYTGREFDNEAGIYYYRMRYYDSQMGRFVSSDPLHFGGDSVNFYSYVNNSPIIGYDPFGLRTKCILAGIGQRTLVCWDDGNPNGDNSVQLTRRPNEPTSPNAAAMAADFDAFSNCASHITVKCMLPKAPGGNPFKPPKGPNGDMGVLPNEGTIPIPQFGDPLAHNCDCLKQYPLAAMDPRF